MKYGRAFAATLALGALVATGPAQAQTIYNFSTSVDFSGPFADVMPSWHSGHRAMVAWWNDTRGKDLGIKVALKVHDTRYDTSVVARVWPSIVAGDKPVIHLGMGTPDLVGLMKRLPEDKIPMMMPTAMVGLVWSPNGWHFSVRPTYSHEFAALFSYMQQQLGEKRALRIGTISTQGRAGYEDQVKGVVKLAGTYKDRFVIADQQWVDDNPVSVTDQIRRMAQAKPDVIMVGATTAQVVAVAKALKELGLKIPIASSSHNGVTEVAKVVPPANLDGHVSVFSFAPYNQAKLAARNIYEKYRSGDGSWGIVAAQAATQTLFALRVLEHAVEKVGKDKVTGETMYRAILDTQYSENEMLGLTPNLAFDTTRPFPTGASAPRRWWFATARSCPLRMRGSKSRRWRSGEARLQRQRVLLELKNIDVVYKGVIQVLRSTNLEVPEGSIVALLGANGAGKTTTLKAVSSFLAIEEGRVTAGQVLFAGDDVTNADPGDLVRRG
ncbi:MAG: ABC transporter substrate-binding protein, partial [Rhodospirillales bacterium]|nr:ABC transporter substrate-binding protein [Rhodospirillales bacterium]